jgi:hypothetical protein
MNWFDKPPFMPGSRGELDGLRWRIENGRKPARRAEAQDLRMLAQVPQEVAVPMSWLFLFVDFLFENEDVLYPPEQGYDGGDKLLSYLNKSVVAGYQFACDSLEVDKALARSPRVLLGRSR